MRHAFDLFGDYGDAGLVHAAREDEAFVGEAFFAGGDEDGRAGFPEVGGGREWGDERVDDCGGVDEVVDAGRGGGPDFVCWDRGWREWFWGWRGGVWWWEVVVCGVFDDGGHGARDVAPGGGEGDAGGWGDWDVLVVEADGGGGALESEECLEEDDAEVCAG